MPHEPELVFRTRINSNELCENKRCVLTYKDLDLSFEITDIVHYPASCLHRADARITEVRQGDQSLVGSKLSVFYRSTSKEPGTVVLKCKTSMPGTLVETPAIPHREDLTRA